MLMFSKPRGVWAFKVPRSPAIEHFLHWGVLWTPHEDSALVKMRDQGCSFADISQALNRSEFELVSRYLKLVPLPGSSKAKSEAEENPSGGPPLGVVERRNDLHTSAGALKPRNSTPPNQLAYCAISMSTSILVVINVNREGTCQDCRVSVPLATAVSNYREFDG
jgi:hypothetical protein